MTAFALVLLVLGQPTAEGNVLASHPSGDPRLTDGNLALDGDGWLSPGAVELRGDVTWDLGATHSLFGAAIQADHNDVYTISGSEDGVRWRELFRAPPVAQGGLRTRSAAFDAQVRYLRLHAQEGDGRASVSELEVFDSTGAMQRSPLVRQPWLRLPKQDLEATWLLALCVVALLVIRGSSPAWVTRTGAALVLLASVLLLARAFSSEQSLARVSWVRLIAALMAMAAVLRERMRNASEQLVLAVLSASAVVGLACFVNLGQPQFFDVGRRAPTALHHYDMRTYFLQTKYFAQLRYDGVYAASAAAMEEALGPAAVASRPIRDLRNDVEGTVALQHAHVAEVRARFSAERWASFVNDVKYFRQAMGDNGFLDSIQDHGGNATPVWLLGAWLSFARLSASDWSLWLGVGIDVALLLLAFASLWWAFGARTALIAMTLFGAMDFYMFGTSWFGAGLRHDWLALWCLGVSALQRDRPMLGGALLAWSAMIRAFPALALVALSVPVAWSVLGLLRARRLTWRDFVLANGAWLRCVAGAALSMAVLFSLSVAVFGLDAWREWYVKVSRLNSDGHLNNIAVLTYGVAKAWQGALVAGLYCAAVAFALRGASLARGAALGAALVGIVFNPANYYLHCFFVLATLGGERDEPSSVPWLVLLLMCVASWFTTLAPEPHRHFMWETVVMMVTVGLLLCAEVLRAWRRLRLPAS